MNANVTVNGVLISNGYPNVRTAIDSKQANLTGNRHQRPQRHGIRPFLCCQWHCRRHTLDLIRARVLFGK
jgi:hypothetical protein